MFLLLLGSYDPNTRRLLSGIQNFIANIFAKEGNYALVMDRLQLYLASDGHLVITERNETNQITLYIFNSVGLGSEHGLMEIDTIQSRHDVQHTIVEYLVSRGIVAPDSTIESLPLTGPASLFSTLADKADLFIVLRLKEETRGGEYIELCWLLLRTPNLSSITDEPRVFLYRKSGIAITQMLDMFREDARLVVLEFLDNGDLEQKLERLVRSRAP